MFLCPRRALPHRGDEDQLCQGLLCPQSPSPGLWVWCLLWGPTLPGANRDALECSRHMRKERKHQTLAEGEFWAHKSPHLAAWVGVFSSCTRRCLQPARSLAELVQKIPAKILEFTFQPPPRPWSRAGGESVPQESFQRETNEQKKRFKISSICGVSWLPALGESSTF